MGCPHPNRLEQAPWLLTADEVADWYAVWQIDPWGEQRGDLRQAALLASLACAFVDHDPPAITFPYWAGEDPTEPAQDVAAALDAVKQHQWEMGYGPDENDGQEQND